MPPTGFQAIILCGPGESLNPFNSNPRDLPKALIPIANRPMVWYPLEWCYRMGITNIHLITPPDSFPALEAALSQNPHLTSLPSHKPVLLAPSHLTLGTGTAEIFRLPEVQDVITGDFVVLPCDIVCELNGSRLLETWMTQQGGLGDAPPGLSTYGAKMGLGGKKSERRGGLGVWYQTKDLDHNESKDSKGAGKKDGKSGKMATDTNLDAIGVKNEQTDFITTTELPAPVVPPPSGSLRTRVKNLVISMPTDTLKDIVEEKQSLHVRHALLRKHGRVRMFTTHRDAHIYFFPYWVKEFILRNDTFENVGEDVLGWWAKAGWQQGLAEKLGLDEILKKKRRRKSEPISDTEDDGIDLASLSSTHTSDLRVIQSSSIQSSHETFASRVPNNTSSALTESNQQNTNPIHHTTIPPILSYIHPAPTPIITSASPSPVEHTLPIPLIRRVDTVPLLLSISLHLARLPPLISDISSISPSPFAHRYKTHPTTPIPPRFTHDPSTTLLDANITLSSKITIRDSVIGANCIIKEGARLNRCLLMEGAVVEEKCILTGCVLGRRAKTGKGCELWGCSVQEGYMVGEGTVGRDEVMAGFDEGGLINGEDGDGEGEDGNEDEEEVE